MDTKNIFMGLDMTIVTSFLKTLFDLILEEIRNSIIVIDVNNSMIPPMNSFALPAVLWLYNGIVQLLTHYIPPPFIQESLH